MTATAPAVDHAPASQPDDHTHYVRAELAHHPVITTPRKVPA